MKDNPIKFKDLADKIKNITEDGFDEEDFDIDGFKKSGIAEAFMEMLSEKLSEPSGLLTEEEIYEEITDNFFTLIRLLGINSFSFFRFKNYDCCREIIIDGSEYDLDGEFCHDDEEATEALCAIDCLMADTDTEDEEAVLKKVESIINIRNRK
ncbi:MAG: hypothetical protein E7543_08805 [Ruminococcaceae bacterium]|nr:hypothetical protein [Oscillospiraceae bacterium]